MPAGLITRAGYLSCLLGYPLKLYSVTRYETKPAPIGFAFVFVFHWKATDDVTETETLISIDL